MLMAWPDTPPALGAPPGESDTQARLGDYLDFLAAPLLGIVPYD